MGCLANIPLDFSKSQAHCVRDTIGVATQTLATVSCYCLYLPDALEPCIETDLNRGCVHPMASTAASSTLSLAWCFEHLLTLPPEVMDDELVRHFAALLVKPQASGKLSMPAPVSARMMLRHLSSGAQLLPAKEVVELLSLIHLLAQQAAQFSSSMQMETLDPGANGMLMDVGDHLLVQYSAISNTRQASPIWLLGIPHSPGSDLLFSDTRQMRSMSQCLSTVRILCDMSVA